MGRCGRSPAFRSAGGISGLLVASLLLLTACGGPSVQDEGLSAQAGSRGGPLPGHHALIIAIGDYPASGGYPVIHADADVPLITAALEERGFAPQVLADEDATLTGIQGALGALARNVGRGDVVVIHYSGHGHRIADRPASEDGDPWRSLDESDGYDEVLVPWDAPASPPSGYDGRKHLIDDELGWHLEQIRRALGPRGHLLVTIDACFSGTATRGLPVRGLPEPIGTTLVSPSLEKQTLAGELNEPRGGGQAGLASMVVISAASDDELSYETYDDAGHAVGSLSLAVARTLPEADADSDTYAGWFQSLSAQMAVLAPRQTPTIEGDVDGLILSGRGKARPAHLLVTDDGEHVRLKHGAVLGANRGTRVSLYPADTSPGEVMPTARATVTALDGVDSLLQVEDPAAGGLDGSWAYVDAWGISDQVTVYLDDTLTASGAANLQSAFADVDRVRLTDDLSGARLMVERRTDGAWLTATDGSGDLQGPFDPESVTSKRQLRAAVLRWARGQLVRDLRLEHPQMAVTLRVIPAREGMLPGECEPDDDQHGVALKTGQPYLLEFENRGRIPAYLTVLNVLPDGAVSQLWPLQGEQPDDLPAGHSWRPPGVCFFAGEQQGTEVLKLLATSEPVDLSPVISSRGSGPKPDGALEALLQSTWGNNRGETSVPSGIGVSSRLGLVVRLQ